MAIVKDSIVEENLLISFDPPPDEKKTFFEELASEPVCIQFETVNISIAT